MDPILSALKVPCLCREAAYRGPFESFPEKNGVDIKALEEGNAGSLDIRELATFVQAWLCFGMICEVSRICEVHFDPSDFIEKDGNGAPVISFAKLETYVWYWTAAESCRSISEKEEHVLACHALLKKANRLVNRINQFYPSTDVEGAVLLSIMGLVDYLTYNDHTIFIPNPLNPEFESFKWNWHRSKLLDNMFLQAGLCKGELAGLYDECSPVTLLYMSTLDRTRKEKDHSRCDDNMCIVNQLDVTTYKPSHAPDCTPSECAGIVASNVQAVCDVLSAGGIPLVRLSRDPKQTSIQVGNFHLTGGATVPYVAISHVWSDGMGNPLVNGLNTCHLRRIQSHVNSLFPTREANVFFWMDTLCVPLRTNMRSLAIVRMAKTYAHATKVLVLDAWLEKSSLNKDPRGLLLRVAKCDWNSRLWTYQEALLARECRFQFASESPTIDDLLDHVPATRNLERISRHLSSLPEDLFWKYEYITVLLKAIVDLDDKSLARIKYYFELPPQDCEDEEDLRLFAINYYKQFGDPYARCQRWAPMVEKLSAKYEGLVDESLRTRLSAVIFDPILGYGMGALQRVRATSHIDSLDREKDLASKSSRQITGFSSPPYGMLEATGQGLLGRMTSRLEDETLCLGGVLGLDVSRMLTVEINQATRNEEVEKVCARRMVQFFLVLRQVPIGILFCEIPRLDEPGFHWAPRTFMSARVRLSSDRIGLITEKGLVTQLKGIMLRSLSLAEMLKHDGLSIKWTQSHSLPEFPPIRMITYKTYNKKYYQTPTDLDMQKRQDFALFRSLVSNNFVAAYAGEENGVPTFQFLFLVSSSGIQSPTARFLSAEGKELKEQTVCIS